MKNAFKILFTVILIFYPFSCSPLAMEEGEINIPSAIKGTVTANGYTCIADESAPFPHPDNPYKTYHMVLSDHFLEQHKNLSYRFPTSGEQVIELGAYKVDKEMDLGSGDDGVVYLARHVPTGIYAAAKHRLMVHLKEEYHSEYQRLKALGQLYGAWRSDKEGSAYLIIPFVDGTQANQSAYARRPWIETTLEGNCLKFSDLSAGLRLVRSMADQLIYITQKGALHDQNAVNILITNDYQNVVLVDFGASDDFNNSIPILKPFNISEFSVPIYSFYCHYLLDTRKYLDELGEGEIKDPPLMVDFLQNIISGRHSNLKLDKFLVALKNLETGLSAI